MYCFDNEFCFSIWLLHHRFIKLCRRNPENAGRPIRWQGCQYLFWQYFTRKYWNRHHRSKSTSPSSEKATKWALKLWFWQAITQLIHGILEPIRSKTMPFLWPWLYGQWLRSDMIRTVAAGQPDQFKKRYLLSGLEAQQALDFISCMSQLMKWPCCSWGHCVRWLWRNTLNHRLGHGIGMDVHELPSIMEGNDMVIEYK